MIQHGAKASQPEVEFIVRQLVGDFVRYVKNKEDPLMSACCKMAKEQNISPFSDWGQASLEQQAWWTEMECNSVVADPELKDPHGAPNCETMLMLTSKVPQKLKKDPIELYAAESACSEVDRAQINATYYGQTDEEALPMKCHSESLVRGGSVRWSDFTGCIQRIFDVSFDCAGCYSDFMKALADVDAANHGCLMKCGGFKACSSLLYCHEPAIKCLECLQPPLNTYFSCMGGPVENQLNIEDVMRKIVHVWGSWS